MTDKKIEKLVVKTVEKIVDRNVNSACLLYFYQPKLSDKIVKKFKKTC